MLITLNIVETTENAMWMLTALRLLYSVLKQAPGMFSQ
jgi:hypothetical protein